MRTELKIGSKILLNFLSGNGCILAEIVENSGTGINSIVYEISYCLKQGGKTHVYSGLLKEFYPELSSEKQFHIIRSENGELQIPSEENADFEAEKKLFLKECEDISALNNSDDGTTENDLNENFALTANNTVYFLCPYDIGNTYEAFKEASLDEIIRNAISIAEAVSVYHQQDYLLLNISPLNVLFTDIKEHSVNIVDFGSATPLDNIKNKPLNHISYSRELAAPELVLSEWDKIGIETDIFAIGIIIFKRIMHRYPEGDELESFSNCFFDKEDSLFGNISPSIYRLLRKLFEKMLAEAPEKRYHTCGELIDDLNVILKVLSPSTSFVVGNINSDYASDNFFVGREKELALIDEAFSQSNVVVINGVGGIGKTHLAKYYGATREFDTVYFAKYKGSVKEFVISLPFKSIDERDFLVSADNEKNDNNIYKRKSELLSTLDEHTLIIVDDLVDTNDRELDLLLGCGAKIIITSRSELLQITSCRVPVSSLDFFNAKKLFEEYSAEAVSDDEFEKFYKLINKSTLLIKLTACAIKKSSGMLKIGDFASNKNGNSFANIGYSVQNSDEFDDSLVQESIFVYLKTLFNVTDITERQVNILIDLSLLCIDEINISEYCEIVRENKTKLVDDINVLDEKGLIQNENGCLRVHPLIADLILEDDSIKPSDARIEQLTLSVMKYLHSIDMDDWGRFKRIINIIVSCTEKIGVHSRIFVSKLNAEIVRALKNGCIDECRHFLTVIEKYHVSDTDEEKMSSALMCSLHSICDVIEGKKTSAAKYQEKIETILESVDVMKYPDDLATIFYFTAIYHRYKTNYQQAIEYLEAYEKLKKGNRLSDMDDVDSDIIAASVYYSSGNYLSALEYHKKIEKKLKNCRGKSASEYRIVNNLNLALTYLGLTNYNKALEYCEKAESDSGFSYDSFLGYLFYNHLVLIYLELNEIKEAQKYSDLEIKVVKAVYGVGSSQYYLSMINHAQVLAENNRKDEAFLVIDEIISELTAKNSENTEELAGAYNLKGMIQMNSGDLENAAKNLKIASGIRKDIYGEKHPNVIISYINIGALYTEMKNFELAEQNLKQALFLCENSDVAGTIINIKASNCMGKLFACEKRYSESIELYKQSLEMKKTLFGRYHFETANAWANLAAVYEACGDVEENIKARLQFEEIALKTNISKDRIMVNYVRISTLLLGLERYDEALEVCEKAKRLGEYIGIESIYNNMGVIFSEREDYDSALDNYNKALSYKTKDNEENFGLIHVNMGVLGLALECYKEAVVCFKEGISLYEKYGAEPIGFMIAFVRCGECYYYADEYENAISVCKRAEKLYLDGKIEFVPLLNLAYEILSNSFAELGYEYNSIEYRGKIRN